MTAVRDPYLDLPLDGVRLIEASAGTGKTYTLATLVTRLVVERGLRIGQILAVTFTDAATQELRKRIRERLQLTLALIDAPVADGEGSEATLTRQLLQSHRDRSEESDDTLRHRLRQATLDIDLAAIFTIHGFCARVLREHALESGHGFDPPELLANDRDLRAELAADLWRQHAQDATTADDLGALWPSHEALADDLRLLDWLLESARVAGMASIHLELRAGNDAARRFYLPDADCPLRYEPSGHDFLSPCIAEADVIDAGQHAPVTALLVG